MMMKLNFAILIGLIWRDRMKPDPLKGKYLKGGFMKNLFTLDEVKSAVEGLIKYHEDNIDTYVKILEDLPELHGNLGMGKSTFLTYLMLIDYEYQDIMVVEHWMDDVIE